MFCLQVTCRCPQGCAVTITFFLGAALDSRKPCFNGAFLRCAYCITKWALTNKSSAYGKAQRDSSVCVQWATVTTCNAALVRVWVPGAVRRKTWARTATCHYHCPPLPSPTTTATCHHHCRPPPPLPTITTTTLNPPRPARRHQPRHPHHKLATSIMPPFDTTLDPHTRDHPPAARAATPGRQTPSTPISTLPHDSPPTETSPCEESKEGNACIPSPELQLGTICRLAFSQLAMTSLG